MTVTTVTRAVHHLVSGLPLFVVGGFWFYYSVSHIEALF